MALRIRKNVWKLSVNDQTLLWYARAVGVMKSRPITDPTSWRYQGAIHEYTIGEDPLENPGEALPSAAERQRFWTRCQHGTWFFLPWHRMYLGWFEKIVQAAITSLGGPTDWALPYWNYSDGANPDARRVPPAFRNPTLMDGSTNHLYVAERARNCNLGNIMAQPFDVDLDCLTEPSFTALANGSTPGFGGPRTGFEHSGGVIGLLEGTPHGSMHVAVGGRGSPTTPPGWMSAFNTAALDPLFWLHHANIDRLWAVWRKRNTQHVDPTLAQWLTGVTFEFHDAAGNIVSNRCQDVVDSTTPALNYRYEEESDPFQVAPSPPTGVVVLGAGGLTMAPAVPEMVGATTDLVLTDAATRARVPVSAPTGPQLAAAGGAPTRMYLNVENITGKAGSQRYALYLNVPENQDPKSHPELLAGVLPMFGLKESSRSDGDHPGSGLQYTFEISRVANVLKSRNDWDPQELRVVFVPYDTEEDPSGPMLAAAPAPTPPVRVGRVSLYVA